MSKNSFEIKVGLAEMLKGGVIMDVTDVDQAKIAEDSGACAVMALERIPSDIPGQAAPMTPTILFSLIVLFTDLMLDVSHFVSILIELTFSSPFKNIFEEFASETANSAEDTIPGTIDSVGPVKPRVIPIVISFAWISV